MVSPKLKSVSEASPPVQTGSRRARPTLWSRVWPPLLATLLALGIWELVVLSGWRPPWVLPGPIPVLSRVAEEILSGQVAQSLHITLGRALIGYALAIGIGTALGVLFMRVRALRAAFGSMITGLQTMPSVAWFPLAILLFKLGEGAILFVVVLGAAPSVINGLLNSMDHVPPLLVRAGRVLGARGLRLLFHVVIPAALPGFVAGLKQGWAFAWRSLMAGELLVILGNRPSVGARLHYARELSDAEGLLAWMIVVLVVGVAVDLLVFGALEARLRRRRGLVEG